MQNYNERAGVSLEVCRNMEQVGASHPTDRYGLAGRAGWCVARSSASSTISAASSQRRTSTSTRQQPQRERCEQAGGEKGFPHRKCFGSLVSAMACTPYCAPNLESNARMILHGVLTGVARNEGLTTFGHWQVCRYHDKSRHYRYDHALISG